MQPTDQGIVKIILRDKGSSGLSDCAHSAVRRMTFWTTIGSPGDFQKLTCGSALNNDAIHFIVLPVDGLTRASIPTP